MATVELKTAINDANVSTFIESVPDETKRQESLILLDMMQKATKQEPKMWGSSIIGFGKTHLVYESGRELDWFLTGFSPRKQNLTLYSTSGGWETFDSLNNLGKYTLGKGCLYIKRLDDVDMPTLKKLVNEAVKGAKTQAKAQAKLQADKAKGKQTKPKSEKAKTKSKQVKSKNKKASKPNKKK